MNIPSGNADPSLKPHDESRRTNRMRPAQDSHEQQLTNRASKLPIRLHKENQSLREELLKLYERETKLLKIIDRRDEQLVLAAQGIAVKVPARSKPNQGQTMGLELEKLKKKVDYLQQRHDALRASKLGSLQLWYWRQRAGK